MRKMLIVLFLLFGLNLLSQSEAIIGEYFLKLGNGKTLDEYTLTLNKDNTFIFHSYRKHENGIPSIMHKYGKGTWRLEGKIISFTADKEQDFNKKYTLNFNHSKARFISKPKRVVVESLML